MKYCVDRRSTGIIRHHFLRVAKFGIFIWQYIILVKLYISYIYPSYYYMGFDMQFSDSRFFIGFLSLMIIVGLLPVQTVDFRSYALHALTLLVTLPMAVLFACGYQVDMFFTSILATAIIIITSKISLPLPKPTLTFKAAAIVIFIFSSLALVLTYRAIGNVTLTFDQHLIYAIRASHEDQLTGLIQYAHMSATRVLLPFMLVIGLIERKLFYVLFSIIAEFAIYALTLHRTGLFVPFVILFIYYIIRSRASPLLLGACLSIFGSLSLFFLDSAFGFWANELVIRRVFFIPAMLNYEYHRFFEVFPFVYWADSKLTFGILPYDFEISVPYLIGAQIGLPHAHANAGFLGSGYMQAGDTGIYIYAFCLGTIIALINSRFRKMPEYGCLSAALIIPLLWIYISSDLPSVFLTHGMALGILLYVFTGKHRSSSQKLDLSP